MRAIAGFVDIWKRRATFQLYRRGYRLAPGLLRPRQSGAQVLLYHNVEEGECSLVNKLGITIRPRDFQEHIRYLVRHYRVVRLEDVCRERSDPRAVALTFDDGLKSVLTTVLPIIEKYQCPIKVYLTTANLRGINWLNKLSYIWNTVSGQELLGLAERALSPPSNARTVSVFDFIGRFDSQRTPPAIDEAFARVHPGPVRNLYLTEEDVRVLASHPLVELGSHTRNHYPLARLDRQQLEEEVLANHDYLNSLFGNRIRGFCIPFGYRSELTREVIDVVRKVDSFVLTGYGGRLDDSTCHGMAEVKRIGVWGNLGTLWYRLRYPD